MDAPIGVISFNIVPELVCAVKEFILLLYPEPARLLALPCPAACASSTPGVMDIIYLDIVTGKFLSSIKVAYIVLAIGQYVPS